MDPAEQRRRLDALVLMGRALRQSWEADVLAAYLLALADVPTALLSRAIAEVLLTAADCRNPVPLIRDAARSLRQREDQPDALPEAAMDRAEMLANLRARAARGEAVAIRVLRDIERSA